MKKFLILIFLMACTFLQVSATVISSGISIDDVPLDLFGKWKINAILDSSTKANTIFKPRATDVWELSRQGDNLTLKNPVTSVTSTVSISSIENNLVIFSRQSAYTNNVILTDTVHIRIDKNKCSGINTLKLDTVSVIDGHLIKSEQATYKFEGVKISGDSIF